MSSVRHPKLGVVVDFANCGPGSQTRIVSDQRRMYLDEGRQPWAYYGPMVAAIRRALADPTPEARAGAGRGQGRGSRQARALRRAAEGIPALARGFPRHLVPVGTGTWVGSDAVFDVAPQLGLRPAKGPKLAVQLYMKEPELGPRRPPCRCT